MPWSLPLAVPTFVTRVFKSLAAFVGWLLFEKKKARADGMAN
jgi:hypothetical protein